MRIENTLPVAVLSLATMCSLNLNCDAAAPALDKSLLNAMQDSHVVPNASIAASVKGTVGTIIVMLPDSQRMAAQAQLKIDAVLLAKKLVDIQPQIARVKTRFCDRRQPTKCKEVVVTIGDIKAFGSRQLSQKELLGSLEVTDVVSSPPMRPTFVPPQNVKPSFETVSESGLPSSDFAAYRNTQAGISLSYPKQFQVKENPPDDKDAIAKISGAIGGGDDLEIRVAVADGGMSKESFARLLEEVLFQKLSDYHKVKEGRIHIGTGRKLDAFYQVISFKIGTLPFQQSYYYVTAGTNLYMLTYTHGQDAAPRVRPFIDQSLATLALSNVYTAPGRTSAIHASNASAAQPSTGASTSARQQLPLRFYRNDVGKIAMSVPSNWKLEEAPEKDVVFRVSGTSPEGMGGLLALYSGDAWPGSTLEQFVEVIEKDYLQKQKSYRKVSEEHRVVGPLSTSSIVQHVTFDSSGAHTLQMNMFFAANGHLYALCLVTPGWRESDARELFNKISSSVRPTDSMP